MEEKPNKPKQHDNKCAIFDIVFTKFDDISQFLLYFFMEFYRIVYQLQFLCGYFTYSYSAINQSPAPLLLGRQSLFLAHRLSLSLSHSLLHTHYLISFNRKFENLPLFTFILFTFFLISIFAFILLVVCLFSVIELRNNSKNNLHQSLLIYSSQPHTWVSEHILMILLSLSIV